MSWDSPFGNLTLNIVAGPLLLAMIAAATWVWRRLGGQGQQERIERKLDEIRDVLGNQGRQPADVRPLANVANSAMEAQIDFALKLQERGLYQEAIETLIAAYSDEDDWSVRLSLHWLATDTYLNLGQYQIAEWHCRQGIDAARHTQDREGEAALLTNLGVIYRLQGRLDQAMNAHADAQAVDQASKNWRQEYVEQTNLGVIHGLRGDLHEAIASVSKGLALAEREGRIDSQANCHMDLGIFFEELGQLTEAEQAYSTALNLYRRLGDRAGEASVLGNLGSLDIKMGDFLGAELHLKAALAIHEEIGEMNDQTTELGNLGILALEQGDLDRAEEFQRRALEIDRQIGDRLGEAASHQNLANIFAERGDDELAEKHYRMAHALHSDAGSTGGVQLAEKGLEDLLNPDWTFDEFFAGRRRKEKRK